MASRFRRLYEWMLPRWMTNGDGGHVIHSIATVVDDNADRMDEGRSARFPSRADNSALARLQSERGIVRGRTETTEHYRERLKRWRYPRGHRVRGSAFALLDQIAEYLGGDTTSGWTIDASGTRHDRAADGTESYSYGNSWTWDSVSSSQWGRFWINVTSDDLVAQDPYGSSLWGGDVDAPEYALGIGGMTSYDASALRGFMRGRWPWRPEGTTGQWMIVSIDGSEPVPDSSWESWAVYVDVPSVGTICHASRSQDHRYIYLSASREQYAGDPNNWADYFTSVGERWSESSGVSMVLNGVRTITEDTSTGYHRITVDPATINESATVVIGGKFKQNSGSRNVYIGCDDGGTSRNISVNLSTGALIASNNCTPSITGPDAAGYYSISMSATRTGTVTNVVIEMVDGVVRSYTGDGSSSIDFYDLSPGEELIAGDPTSFPSTITLPDGTTYAGNPTAFPSTIVLVDDGD